MLTILLFTAVLAYLIHFQYEKRKKLPPGPMPLLFFGNMFQFGYVLAKTGSNVEAFKYFKRIYGPVFTLWMGPMPTVHICDLQLAQDTMVKDGETYVDRWAPYIMRRNKGGRGIINTNGKMWQDQRRFALHTLRNFGLGRDIMEERIMEEFEMRIKELTPNKSDGSWEGSPTTLIDPLVGSIINRMLFAYRFENDTMSVFHTLKGHLDSTFESTNLLDIYVNDWMEKLPFVPNYMEKRGFGVYRVTDFVRDQLEERMKNIKAGKHVINESEPDDYVDAFLVKMEKEEKENARNTTFDKETLIQNLTDLWMAGQETTATTLICGILHLVRNPEIVPKVRQELEKIASDRPLSLKDKSSTPFLNALIMETQRHASILSINLWRRAGKDTTVGGYPLAEGTTVTAELSVIMDDEKLFDQDFHPERFFEGKKNLEQNIIPFGIGKRACLGESLARAELYLILGNLIKRFDFQSVDGKPCPKAINPNGILRRSKPYRMCLKPTK